MEKRTSWLIVVLLVAQLLIVAAAPVVAGSDAPAGAYAPGSITLDREAMHKVAVLGEQMQSYLAFNKDGTLSLGEVDTAALNVTDEYLKNYKAALEYINAAIKQGLFTVDENFQVSWPDEAESAANVKAPDSAEPDWYPYPTSSGLYIYFSYSDVRYYVPYYGLSVALSLAAYCGRPYIATPFTYHFTYYPTYQYYYYYSYPHYGIWVYVPWYYLPPYSCCYSPAYRYAYFWYPYGYYWYYVWCYY